MNTDLEKIYIEWESNPQFREQFKKDPVKALEAAGFNLNPEDLKKIIAIFRLDRSKNEALDDRINK